MVQETTIAETLPNATALEWRSFFTEPSINRYLSKSILLATHQSIQLLDNVGIITSSEAQQKYAELTALISTDMSESFNVAYWTYVTSNQGSKGLVGALGVARQSSAQQEKRLQQQISAHYLRWRELLPLARSLKEIRNTAVHELNREADPSWVTYVAACILRFTFLSASPRSDELTTVAVQRRAINLIKSTHAQEADQTKKHNEDNNDYLPQIADRLQSIEALLTKAIPSPPQKSTSKKEAPELTDDLVAIPAPTTQEGDFLTEAILKMKLIALRDNIRSAMLNNEVYSPSDNILQVAIINEVIINKLSNIDDALALPDVAWRIQNRRAIIDAQLSSYREEINEMLEKTAWDSREEGQ